MQIVRFDHSLRREPTFARAPLNGDDHDSVARNSMNWGRRLCGELTVYSSPGSGLLPVLSISLAGDDAANRGTARRGPHFGPMPKLPIWSYPAMIACINDARAPTLGEVKRVSKRIRRELALDRDRDGSRRATHMAFVALSGATVPGSGPA